MPLLPIGRSCALETILLSDLVGCDSPLHIVMAIWRAFKKFEASKTAIIVNSGPPHPTQQIQIKK